MVKLLPEKEVLAPFYHKLEIILEEAIMLSTGLAKGPDVMIFRRFQSSWERIIVSDHHSVTFMSFTQ